MLFRFSLVFLTAVTVAVLWTVSPPRLIEDLYAPGFEQEDIAEPVESVKSNSEIEVNSIVDSAESFDAVIETAHPSNSEPSTERKTSATETFGAPIIDDVRPTPDSVAHIILQQNEQAHTVVTLNNECQPAIIHGEDYQQQQQPIHSPQYSHAPQHPYSVRQSHPAMNVDNLSLFQYRRMMLNHAAPQLHELQGSWRGINKGVATLAIDRHFIKHFQSVGGQIYGDNISVHQSGWQPIYDPSTNGFKRGGRFQVQNPRGIGAFRHGAVLSYRSGGNRLLDPARLIEDKLVKLDDNHMLGRATANFGPIKIPLAFFVIERIQE